MAASRTGAPGASTEKDRKLAERVWDVAHDHYCDLAPHPRGKHHPDQNPYRSGDVQVAPARGGP